MQIWTLGIPTPVALAAIAVIGYLVGRRQRRRRDDSATRDELRRAKTAVRHLESVSQQVRRSLANHHAGIQQFRDRIGALCRRQDDAAWRQLSEEAERMIAPTLGLSQEIARAYEEFRRQTGPLQAAAQVRIDPLTGLDNRRGVRESLRRCLSQAAGRRGPLSLAIFQIDRRLIECGSRGGSNQDLLVRQAARVLEDCCESADVLGRVSAEEFVLLMPQTDLIDASRRCDRIVQAAWRSGSLPLRAGVAEAAEEDTPSALMTRADAALYSAESAGRNRVFRHTGHGVEPTANRGMGVDRCEPPAASAAVGVGESGSPSDALTNLGEQEAL